MVEILDAPTVIELHDVQTRGGRLGAAGAVDPIERHHHNLSPVLRRPGAFRAYQSAREALETLRSRLNGEELKIAFVKNKGEVYERLVQLCLEGEDDGTNGFEGAFAFVEQAKSRTLFDLMFQPVHALSREEGSQSQLALSMRELREELNWYYHLFELEQLRPGEHSFDRIAAFRREIGTREKEMARTLRELSVSDAAQADLHAPSALSLDAIRAVLSADTTILEFFQVDDRIVLVALNIHPGETADLAALCDNGWKLLGPEVAATPGDYVEFVRGSKAEFGIAKSGYVASRSGWFSDRSACYLASGRPVVAQDTGWSEHLPAGEGLFAFNTADDVWGGR